MAPTRKTDTKDRENRERHRSRYEESIRRHKIRKALYFGLGIVLLIVVIVAIKVTGDTKKYTTYKVKKSVDRSVSADAGCMAYAGSVLTYSVDGASCMDTNGSQIWNITYQMQNPLVDIRGEYVAIGDYNGDTLYVMNKSGKQGEIAVPMPIRRFSISANGYVAVITGNTSGQAIYVYSRSGEQVGYFHVTMKDSGYPFDISVSDQGKLIAVEYLYIEEAVSREGYMSRVAFYNFGSVGRNFNDQYVSGYDYSGEVIGCLKYMNDKNSFSLSPDRLVFYSGKEIPKTCKEIPLEREIRNYYYSDSYVALVSDSETSDHRYQVDVYSINGRKGSFQIDIQYDEIVFRGGYCLVYNNAECAVYSVSGQKIFQGFFDINVSLAMLNSKNSITIVSKDNIEVLQLK
ncbi:MAG: DUF5711 family protein [Lachnospiraceae bacterium]